MLFLDARSKQCRDQVWDIIRALGGAIRKDSTVPHYLLQLSDHWDNIRQQFGPVLPASELARILQSVFALKSPDEARFAQSSLVLMGKLLAVQRGERVVTDLAMF